MREGHADYFCEKAESEGKAEIPHKSLEPLIADLKYEDVSEDDGRISSRKKIWNAEGGTENVKLSLSYGPSGGDEVIKAAVDYDGDPKKKKFISEHISQWRILESYILEDKAGNKIDLTPLLMKKPIPIKNIDSYSANPVEYRQVTVLFPATEEIPDIKDIFGVYRETGKGRVIWSSVNINSSFGLLLLLHELGHANLLNQEDKNNQGNGDGQRWEEVLKERRYRSYISTLNKKLLTEEEKNDPNINSAIAGHILEEERNAWAQVLRQLRPFFASDALDKETILAGIHSYALKLYSENLRRLVEPSLFEDLYRKGVSFINTMFNAN